MTCAPPFHHRFPFDCYDQRTGDILRRARPIRSACPHKFAVLRRTSCLLTLKIWGTGHDCLAFTSNGHSTVLATLKPAITVCAMELSILLTSFVLFVVAVSLFYAHKNSRGPAALPPGPKPLPFIGNLLDVPKEYEWLHWAKHKDIYGPISMVSVLGKNIVIINDFQLAVDILNKRSTIYSDRPTFTFSTKL